ncbi:MAG: CRISPR-associated endonuclease Cas2 [Acidobacteria bacterium]|nr:CRISPR-associated endonuclease Cas2 [Acidobacteriota bacterium]
MQYVVCYDIADDRRREHVATALLDFGKRVQESVFVASLDEELLGRMMGRVERLIEVLEDRVHVFPMCEECVGKVKLMGRGEMPEERAFYVV